MIERAIGRSGIISSAVGLGTWAIGGWMWGGTDEKDAVAAIHASLDEGITLVDTAPAYGLGLSEEIVGKAIADRRDKVVLATKCGLEWHTQKGTHFFDQHGKAVYRYLGADSIRHEVEESLKRLQTDYIDLYQTHWQDATTPIEETMSMLLDLKKEGKIRAIGISNVNVDHLKEYMAIGQVDSAQEKYSMLDRGLELEILPFCREHTISILAYSPLALGLLTGKIGPDREFKGDDLRQNNPRFAKDNLEKTAAMLGELKPIAKRNNVTLAQLVIAWTIAQPGVTFSLVGARNVQQAQENARAGQVELSEEDITTINKVLDQYAPNIT